jgi:L-ascorbate metabolism protein UlaG (beta-lactamase superfamily)
MSHPSDTLIPVSTASPAPATLRQLEGRYVNLAPRHRAGTLKTLGILWNSLFNKPADTRPAAPIPVQAITRHQLLAAPDNSVWRLGHSTVLLKLHQRFWLTDPVFAERASPVQWAGPKRFHQPPISLDELPPLAAVILSHNHYDHLDRATVLALKDRAEHFLAPLGVGQMLIEWGVPAAKVHELNWWQSVRVHGVELVAAPAQHFSGRGLRDSNKTLWASWVIIAERHRMFFSGDTGYHSGFKLIGERFGPFDLTLMETGAYNVDWPDVHMHPEQSLQAHVDVRGRWLMPIHNGTFDLALHAWHEPLDRIQALAWESNVRIATPEMGQPFYLDYPSPCAPWWIGVAEGEGAVVAVEKEAQPDWEGMARPTGRRQVSEG